MNIGNSLTEQSRYEHKGERAQNRLRTVFTNIGESHIDAARAQPNGVVQTGIGIEPNFDSRHGTIACEVTKGIDKKLIHFIHRPYSCET